MAAPWLTFHPSPLRSPHEGLTGYLCYPPLRFFLSFFLRSLLRRAALPRYYRARSYYPGCPCSARPRRTTYRDFNVSPVRATMTMIFPNPLIWRPSIKDPPKGASLIVYNSRVFQDLFFIISGSLRDFTCQYLPAANVNQVRATLNKFLLKVIQIIYIHIWTLLITSPLNYRHIIWSAVLFR